MILFQHTPDSFNLPQKHASAVLGLARNNIYIEKRYLAYAYENNMHKR